METKDRKPLLAALLSFITPGLGQLYNGELKKGVIFFILILVLSVLLALAGLQYHFYGLLTFLLCDISAQISVSIEAFLKAKKIRELSLQPYNKWYYYLLIVLLSFGVDWLTDHSIVGIDHYRIPSGSMETTLLVGDYIIVDLNRYKKSTPRTGDVVVFKFKNDPSKLTIKRVVGNEGDVLESRDKIVYINGTALNEPYTIHVDPAIATGEIAPRDNFGPLTVPNGKIFLMGDNRDQSYDSRFLGYSDKKDIIGKVLFIVWSKQKDRIGKEIQ